MMVILTCLVSLPCFAFAYILQGANDMGRLFTLVSFSKNENTRVEEGKRRRSDLMSCLVGETCA